MHRQGPRLQADDSIYFDTARSLRTLHRRGGLLRADAAPSFLWLRDA
jgi:hypothetical protein